MMMMVYFIQKSYIAHTIKQYKTTNGSIVSTLSNMVFVLYRGYQDLGHP